MPLLYKYLDPGGIEALRKMTLVAADPSLFNDPFEVRPCFDQERHDYFASTHEAFHAQFGFPHSLLGTSSMVGLPTENAVDFGEQINERFRRDLSRRFRVVCLSRDPSSVLMWGHSYFVVVSLAVAVPGFNTEAGRRLERGRTFELSGARTSRSATGVTTPKQLNHFTDLIRGWHVPCRPLPERSGRARLRGG